jgi:hypothetical protein
VKCFKFHKLSDEEQGFVLAKLEFYNVQSKLSIYGDADGRYLMWEGDGFTNYLGLQSALGVPPHKAASHPAYFTVPYMPEDLLGKGLIPYMGLPA